VGLPCTTTLDQDALENSPNLRIHSTPKV
jgi:hypothetical protein